MKACITLAAVAALMLSAAAVMADSIGVQFAASGVPLTSTETAGLVPQANFNVVTSNASPSALVNSAGAASGASLTYSSSSTYGNQGSPAPYNGTYDETLNSGLVNGGGTQTFTISGINYSGGYNLIVYELDNAARTEGTAIGSSVSGPTAVYLESPNATTAGYADGNPATPYTYIRGTGASATTPTVGADYVEFTGLTGSSVTFAVNAPQGTGIPGDQNGNVFVTGFEIVAAPEPSSVVALVGLCGMGLVGLICYRRRTVTRNAA